MARKPKETRDERITRVANQIRRALLAAGSEVGGGNENEPFRFHHDLLAHLVLELGVRDHAQVGYHDAFTKLVMAPSKRAFPKDSDARTRVMARVLRGVSAGIADVHDH